MCAYCGCHTKVTRKAEPIAAYRDRLLAEIDLIAFPHPGARVKHLHWGGGTPTMLVRRGSPPWPARHRVALPTDGGCRARHRARPPAGDARPGRGPAPRRRDPRQPRRADLPTRMCRRPSAGAAPRVVVAAVEALHAAGIDRISFDLMYGLPHQQRRRPPSFDHALGRHGAEPHLALRLCPCALVQEPPEAHRRGGASRCRRALPSGGGSARGADRSRLRGGGSRPLRARRRFHGHRRPRADAEAEFPGLHDDDAEALIGFGASAIGRLPQGFVQNAPDLGGYQRAIDAGRPAGRRCAALRSPSKTASGAMPSSG